MIKRILLFLLISIMFVCIGTISVYIINPYAVESKHIRPRLFGFDIYRIPSKSMQPTLQIGDYISVSHTAYHHKKATRGDVVVFYSSDKDAAGIPFIKRVLAIGGDTIQLQNGHLFINKALVEQNHILLKNQQTPYSLEMKEFTVPSNHVFVLGDNRDNSADSRIFGPVSQTAIIGKASNILLGINNRLGIKIK